MRPTSRRQSKSRLRAPHLRDTQGSYSKDGVEFTSTCSIVLGGNINADMERRQPLDGYRHLFQPLPEELRDDTAFLDRVHAYLPGWESRGSG